MNLIHIQDVGLFVEHSDFGVTPCDQLFRLAVKQEYRRPFQLAINGEFQSFKQFLIRAGEVVFCHTFASQRLPAENIETLSVKVLVCEIVNGDGIPFRSGSFK